MKRLEWVLKRQGYAVINESYPSTRLSIEEAADAWLSEILARAAVREAPRVHFVTHSAGGIVLRQYLAEHELARLGRVVMLAPPNQGSELADRLKHNLLFRKLTGPAGQELGTGADDLPQCLPAANFDLGVIAGNRSLNPLFSAWIPGPDDGKVSVARARLDGMKEMLVVARSHTWMMWRLDVTRALGQFLKRGTFTGRFGQSPPRCSG
jgi:pimeloyl-ACP methyl ester carboxylesterase